MSSGDSEKAYSGEYNNASGENLKVISGDYIEDSKKYIDFMRGDEIISYKTDKYILKYYDVKDKDLYWQYIDNPEIIIKNAEIPIIECYAVLQDHYYNNEILTIIVSGKENDYIIYNIDMNSLEFLSNEDILNLMGLSSDDMKNIINNTTIKLVNKIYTGNDLKSAIEYI